MGESALDFLSELAPSDGEVGGSLEPPPVIDEADAGEALALPARTAQLIMPMLAYLCLSTYFN